MTKGNKVALVTGASRGIGKAVALELSRKGYSLAIHFHGNEEQALNVAAQIRDDGGTAEIVQGDIGKKIDAQKIVDFVFDLYGRLDLLVNNAGITKDSAFMLMNDDAWLDVINTNLTGTFYMTKAAIYRMYKQGGGAVVNVSSVAGLVGIRSQANYCASKAGIIGMTKSIAKEVSDKNIRVNCVAPGYIETDMTAGLPDKFIEAAKETIPVRQFGCAENVAKSVVFLASDESKYINGHTITVDGGLTA